MFQDPYDISDVLSRFGTQQGFGEAQRLGDEAGMVRQRALGQAVPRPRRMTALEGLGGIIAALIDPQMGAGFAISMRDLEIRGAGNLLGSQQSGHIAAVGYELYCSLLEDAVRQAQNLPPKLSADVDIDLPVEACLPPDYVADLRHKIDLYRRIGKIDHIDQIREIDARMRRLAALRAELGRMAEACAGGTIGHCRIIETLADFGHGHCADPGHGRD